MAKTKKDKNKRRRLITSIILTIFFLGFILFNVAYDAGILYLTLSVISLLIVMFWEKIPKRRPERKLFSFQKDWFWDFMIGIGVGFGVLFIMSIVPGLSIAGPSLPSAGAFPAPFASAGQWLVITAAAPLAEEAAFRTVLFAVFFVVIGFSFFWSAVISSLAFSLYHIKSYAGEIALNPVLAVSGALLSAFLIGILFCYINKWRGSITTSLGAHSSINGGIVGSQFVIVG